MDYKEIKQKCAAWWYCDNLVNHPSQFALLRMDFPQVFVLIRDSTAQLCTFDEFKTEVAEVNFFNPRDREDADLDAILTEAWNFLALQEEIDRQVFEQTHGYQDDEEEVID